MVFFGLVVLSWDYSENICWDSKRGIGMVMIVILGEGVNL